MNEMMCASCGLPGHRYGRNEGMDRYDPMACINSLRGELEKTPELLALAQAVQTLAEAVEILAGNMGQEQMEKKAQLVASDLADAIGVGEEG